MMTCAQEPQYPSQPGFILDQPPDDSLMSIDQDVNGFDKFIPDMGCFGETKPALSSSHLELPLDSGYDSSKGLTAIESETKVNPCILEERSHDLSKESFSSNEGHENGASENESIVDNLKSLDDIQPIVRLQRLEMIHSCPSCVYTTPNKSNLSRHFESVHLRYKCRECDRCPVGRRSLIDHLRRAHKNFKNLNYGAEDIATDEDLELLKRVKESVSRMGYKQKQIYKCSKCNYQTIKQIALIRHKCKNGGDKEEFIEFRKSVFRCIYCSQEFKSGIEMADHVTDQHFNTKKFSNRKRKHSQKEPAQAVQPATEALSSSDFKSQTEDVIDCDDSKALPEEEEDTFEDLLKTEKSRLREKEDMMECACLSKPDGTFYDLQVEADKYEQCFARAFTRITSMPKKIFQSMKI